LVPAGDVAAAASVAVECLVPGGSIIQPAGVGDKRVVADRGVVKSARVEFQRIDADGGIFMARGVRVKCSGSIRRIVWPAGIREERVDPGGSIIRPRVGP